MIWGWGSKESHGLLGSDSNIEASNGASWKNQCSEGPHDQGDLWPKLSLPLGQDSYFSNKMIPWLNQFWEKLS